MARRSTNDGTPALHRSMIIEAALAVLNNEGLGNLTLRRVATELGVQAPAIYWHVKDKTTLIDYMAEAILQTQFSDLHPRGDGEPWQDWLIGTMKKLRTAMWTYRDGGRIVTGAHLFPAVTLIKLFETSYMSLTSAGVDIKTADIIVGTTVHFVFGRVIEEQSGPSPEQFKHLDIRELFTDYPLFLRSLDTNPNYSDEFEQSLRLIIRGASVQD